MKISRKIFKPIDQIIFSKLSHDYNPIHIDQKESRRLISGECIVHGVHSVLWALEELLKIKKINLSTINVEFLKQINLYQNVEVFWFNSKKKLIIKSDLTTHIIIHINIDKIKSITFKDNQLLITKNLPKHPNNFNINDLRAGQTFKVLVGGKINYSVKLFPLLLKHIGINTVFEICLLSYIIGMQVPGLNSIFSSVKIIINRQNNNNLLNLDLLDSRFGFANLSYFGNNINAKLKAFFRPSPINLPSVKYIEKKIKKKINLENINILIIGGSRGIGAWITKLVTISGANVTMTYSSGKKEAELIKSDLLSIGLNCKIKKLSISDKHKIKLPSGKFDHLYYFPTPKTTILKIIF